jgi:hypothetical protein
MRYRQLQMRMIGLILTTALGLPLGAQTAARPATIGGHPNLNGVWQVLNTANWNLEAHSAEAIDNFWGMGAIAAIPAGKSVVREGTIPYVPAAATKRDQNRGAWPAEDPEARCYMLGVPRVTYHSMPFQIFQGGAGDMLMVYPFAATNRIINFADTSEPPLDSWMGKSVGKWDGKTLVVTTTNQYANWLDRAGNHRSDKAKITERFTSIDASHINYMATVEDPETYSKPWTIEMPLYRLIEDHAQIMEHKCVPFADKLFYSDLLHIEQPQPKPIKK